DLFGRKTTQPLETHSCRHNFRDSGSHRRLGSARIGCSSSRSGNEHAAQKSVGATKTEMVPSLIVMNAQGASLQGETPTLSGVAPSTIVFTDRPVRAAGHMLTAHLVEGWGREGEGFVKDPPNATVSVFNKSDASVHDAVVVLKTPKLAADHLTFAVKVLEGDLSGADGPASVFIDTADFEVSELQSMFPSTNWPPSMRH